MNFRKYLPPKSETAAVQVDISADLKRAAAAKMKKEKLSWVELVSALLSAYVEEDSQGKKQEALSRVKPRR